MIIMNATESCRPVNCGDNDCTVCSCCTESWWNHATVIGNDRPWHTTSWDTTNGCEYAVVCDNNDLLTVDSCVSDPITCQFNLVNCNDWNPYADDFCVDGEFAYYDVIYDDYNDCTNESCNEDSGYNIVIFVSWFLSLMTCDSESGCVYTEISCDDYDDCTTDFPGCYPLFAMITMFVLLILETPILVVKHWCWSKSLYRRKLW